jgi:hypothetical protein
VRVCSSTTPQLALEALEGCATSEEDQQCQCIRALDLPQLGATPEVLSFRVPAHAAIPSFDEATVRFELRSPIDRLSAMI